MKACRAEALGVTKAPCKAQYKEDKKKFKDGSKELKCARAIEGLCETHGGMIQEACEAQAEKGEKYTTPIVKFNAAKLTWRPKDPEFEVFWTENECGKKPVKLMTIEVPHATVTNQCPNAFGTAGPAGTHCCGPQLKDLCEATQ